MEITTKNNGDILVIELIGRFDSDYINTENMLKNFIQNHLKIIIDCENLVYINSFGLRVFLKVLKFISKEEGNLVFCNLNDNLKSVFAITGFLHLFQVFDNIEEAIEVFH